ncbi:MAG: TM2 domain-containing protein [Bacteroidales bacterium]|nr:TM2 domain-containing protein [Bacteroidales bacterium]
MYCSNCGAEVNDNAVVCIKCGCAVNQPKMPSVNGGSSKDWLVTLLLCFFVGCFGIHRFYVGKTGTAIVQLITCGGCGIWALIDFIVICMGNFTDAEGKFIKNRP